MIVSDLIAQALIDASAEVVTYVPGFGGSAIFDAFERKTGKAGFISFNEEVAFTVAHGASLTGKRAALLCKTHGIMKAANSVSDSLQTGTTSGMIVIIPEDTGGTHSDTIIDTEPFLNGIGMPNIRSHPGSIYDDIHRAYELSEQQRLPCAIVINAGEVDHNHPYIPRYSKPRATYHRDIVQHVLCPLFNTYQRKVYEVKMKGGKWERIQRPVIPVIPEATSQNWKEAVRRYMNFFSVFKRFRGDIVTGDTGISSQFCADPWKCVDIVSYMGGSIPLAIGAYLAGHEKVWAVTGDFSFISAGPMALLEATLRHLPLKVIIFDNAMAGTTGGQAIPAEALGLCLKPWEGSLIRVKDPDNPGMVENALKEIIESSDLKIMVLNYRAHP